MKILFVFGTTALLLAGSLTGTLLAEQSEEAPKVDPKAGKSSDGPLTISRMPNNSA